MEIKNRALYYTTGMKDELIHFCFTAVDPFNDETVAYQGEYIFIFYIYHHAPHPFESNEWVIAS